MNSHLKNDFLHCDIQFLQVFFLIQTTITGNNSCLVWQIFQSIDHAHYGRLCMYSVPCKNVHMSPFRLASTFQNALKKNHRIIKKIAINAISYPFTII